MPVDVCIQSETSSSDNVEDIWEGYVCVSLVVKWANWEDIRE